MCLEKINKSMFQVWRCVTDADASVCLYSSNLCVKATFRIGRARAKSKEHKALFEIAKGK